MKTLTSILFILSFSLLTIAQGNRDKIKALKIAFITEKLKEQDIRIHIETSGAYQLSGEWDWICLSPKKTKLPLEAIYKKADELKIIISNKHDFKFAEEQAKKVTQKCELYLQPEWSKREKMTPFIIDYVMKNPQWKISLQTHKYLNIP